MSNTIIKLKYKNDLETLTDLIKWLDDNCWLFYEYDENSLIVLQKIKYNKIPTRIKKYIEVYYEK